MDDSGRQRWLSTAILVGVIYLAVGFISATLAGTAASDQMRFIWRWFAFVISAVAFAAHVAYEHFRVRNTARPTAWHTSVAVAFGAFGLALMANIHDLSSASGLPAAHAHRARGLAAPDRSASIHCCACGSRWPRDEVAARQSRVMSRRGRTSVGCRRSRRLASGLLPVGPPCTFSACSLRIHALAVR